MKQRTRKVVHRPLGHKGVIHHVAYDVDAGGHAVLDPPGDTPRVPLRKASASPSEPRRDAHDIEAAAFSSHESGVLCFVVEGAGVASVADAAEFVVGAGDVVVIPAGAAHKLRWTAKAHISALSVCATCAAVQGEVLDAPWQRVRAGGAPVLRLPAERRSFVAGLLRAVADEQARAQPSSQAQLALLTLLLTEVARAGDSVGSDDDDLVAAALRLIEQRCLTPLKPKDVAQALGKSSTHLTTLVRQRTGQPLQAWITAGRMAEARRRLQTSDEHIDVVAERVGYGDVRGFVRAFRAATGQTPAAFRAAFKRGSARG